LKKIIIFSQIGQKTFKCSQRSIQRISFWYIDHFLTTIWAWYIWNVFSQSHRHVTIRTNPSGH